MIVEIETTKWDLFAMSIRRSLNAPTESLCCHRKRLRIKLSIVTVCFCSRVICVQIHWFMPIVLSKLHFKWNQLLTEFRWKYKTLSNNKTAYQNPVAESCLFYVFFSVICKLIYQMPEQMPQRPKSQKAKYVGWSVDRSNLIFDQRIHFVRLLLYFPLHIINRKKRVWPKIHSCNHLI